jgi:hypothetical protein
MQPIRGRIYVLLVVLGHVASRRDAMSRSALDGRASTPRGPTRQPKRWPPRRSGCLVAAAVPPDCALTPTPVRLPLPPLRGIRILRESRPAGMPNSLAGLLSRSPHGAHSDRAVCGDRSTTPMDVGIWRWPAQYGFKNLFTVYPSTLANDSGRRRSMQG